MATQPQDLSKDPKADMDTWKHTLLLSFQSLGVIYGHLSIGPLHAKVSLLPNNKGDDDELLAYEMGSFYKSSLGSKAKKAIEHNRSCHYLMLLMALLGSCMIIGNGVLVPAISVLSASVSLEKSLKEKFLELNSFKYMSVSIACPILIGLFMLQHYGTHKIGFLFAPIAFGVLVYPSLIFCYMGQTAFISKNWNATGEAYVTHLGASAPTTKNVAPIGNATGLAIITSMLITTFFMSLIIALYWNRPWLSAIFLLFFGPIEVTYFCACGRNFHRREFILFFPMVIILLIMLAWHYGTMKKYEFDLHNKVSIECLTNLGPSLGVVRVPGIGLVYTDIMSGIPAFFSHFVTHLPAFHQVLIFVSFKSVPVPYVPPSMRYIIGRMGPKEYRLYRCIVRYGYRDGMRDMDDIEDEIICGIGEFISTDHGNSETLSSPEDKLIVAGILKQEGNAFITLGATDSTTCSPNSVDVECPTMKIEKLQIGQPTIRRKKVRFVLPPESPEMSSSAREELQELLDAREYGMTYILGHSHLSAHQGSNYLRKFVTKVYIFLVNNCKEHKVPLTLISGSLASARKSDVSIHQTTNMWETFVFLYNLAYISIK
ncbi:putative potassium transporter 7 [Cocos nucifera]|uniref:Putative potassium transporter 7 n=1 Tax=Cocos nucifera TaxID=13894 RepID=A0A8K0N5T4_COCNU|nr:putative potassium transporter 7 [Cocos nucifera]